MSENTPTTDSELGAILELQRMIAEELEDTPEDFHFSRSFMPLTNGLGLESPPKKKEVATTPPVAKLVPEAEKLFDFGDEQEVSDVWDSTRRRVQAQTVVETPPLSRPVVNTPVPPPPAPMAEERRELRDAIEPARQIKPPPVPRPSIWRRGFAAFVDELFVLACFAILVLITSNIMANSKNYFSLTALTTVHQPTFFRYALMEFATLWLGYFAICLGILDMTFGMWVWGIRVGYAEGQHDDDARVLKKMIRVILSFFFFAPVAPLILLFVRIRGKNMLDGLSGTHLYRSVV